MHFTREPIIETIITPKEGYKLVVRNSKGSSYEEFFVDAIQIVTIGSGCFFRSLEKPKPFMVPASDYEIVESRETKMVLKIPSAEKGGIKIGGGRETSMKMPREAKEEEVQPEPEHEAQPQQEPKTERRKDKRRLRRRRGDRFEAEAATETPPTTPREEKQNYIIPPPSTLISETIARYKDIPGFASAFFEKGKEEDEEVKEESEDANGNVREEEVFSPDEEDLS